MKKAFIAVVLSLSLFIGFSQNVFAAPIYGIPYKAIITHPKKMYWYSFYAPNWIRHKGHPEWLKTGTIYTITRHAGFGTMITGNHHRHVSTIDKETFWMVPTNSTSWYDVYQKHTYIDTGLFHGAKKRTGKSYNFSWKRYCKLVRMGLWDLPTHPNRNKKINQQIKEWNLKAE